MPKVLHLVLTLLASLVVSLTVSAQPDVEPEKPPFKELFQDFREGNALHPSLKLRGPDVDTVVKRDDQGLRITLPATREVNHPIKVITTFSLSGDFEITGTYELMSADRPKEGYGVGVALNVATNEARDKFAKVSRMMRAKEGSVYLAEYWRHDPLPKDYGAPFVKSEAKAGKLRLVREGSTVRFVVADAPDYKFREIAKPRNFGTEEIAYAEFVIADSGSPGNAVDARLVDLKIRAGSVPPALAAVPANSPEPERKTGSSSWLMLVIALSGFLVIALSVGAFLLVRQRRRAEPPPVRAVVEQSRSEPAAASTSISFQCSACGKNLKVKAELAGKKVKCPKCGTGTLVPSNA